MTSFGRCCICTLSFSLSTVSSLKCGHTFHQDCVKRWIENSKTCPNCRKRTAEKDITRLYFEEPDLSASQSFLQINDLESIKAELRDQKNLTEDLQKTLDKNKAEVKSLSEELKKEKVRGKRRSDEIQSQTQLIQHLETQLEYQGHLQRALKDAENKYKACQFYSYLMHKSDGDERELNKYLSSGGDINAQKFLAIMKKQLEEAKIINKGFREEMSTLRKQRIDLQSELKELNDKVRELEKREEDNALMLLTKETVKAPKHYLEINNGGGFSFYDDNDGGDDVGNQENVLATQQPPMGFSFSDEPNLVTSTPLASKQTSQSATVNNKKIIDDYIRRELFEFERENNHPKKGKSPLKKRGRKCAVIEDDEGDEEREVRALSSRRTPEVICLDDTDIEYVSGTSSGVHAVIMSSPEVPHSFEDRINAQKTNWLNSKRNAAKPSSSTSDPNRQDNRAYAKARFVRS